MGATDPPLDPAPSRLPRPLLRCAPPAGPGLGAGILRTQAGRTPPPTPGSGGRIEFSSPPAVSDRLAAFIPPAVFHPNHPRHPRPVPGLPPPRSRPWRSSQRGTKTSLSCHRCRDDVISTTTPPSPVSLSPGQTLHSLGCSPQAAGAPHRGARVLTPQPPPSASPALSGCTCTPPALSQAASLGAGS